MQQKKNEPLTPEERVDRLFDTNDFPTYQEIVEVIKDAEFDTINFPEVIAKRHGLLPDVTNKKNLLVGRIMTDLEKEIHSDAREATARRTYAAMVKEQRPDIAIAILLRAIDEWYEKGVEHGKNNVRQLAR